jgi:hypothetical protein
LRAKVDISLNNSWAYQSPIQRGETENQLWVNSGGYDRGDLSILE